MKTLTKCFLLLVVLLCSEQMLLAQAIKGTVVDAEGKPIELAHVIARKYNRQNEASGTKGTKRTKLKLLRRNEAYA